MESNHYFYIISFLKQQKQQKQQADLRESNIKLVWILPSARLEDKVNIAI